MGRVLSFALSLPLLGVVVFAQPNPVSVTFNNPSGLACQSGQATLYAAATTIMFTCQSGVFVQVTGGGGSSLAPFTTDGTNVTLPAGTLTVGNTMLDPVAGIMGNTAATQALYQRIVWQAWLGPTPLRPGPIPTNQLVARYDLTSLVGGTTSVANLVSGGVALTLVGTPTLATGGISFAGGTQYAVTASTISTLPLTSPWSVIAVINQSSNTNGSGILSLAATANDTNYNSYYAVSQDAPNNRSTGKFTSRMGSTLNNSGPTYTPIGGTYFPVMMSFDGTNVYITRLDTGAVVSVVNAGPTGNPRIGLGADARQNIYSITDSLSASYLLAYARVPTQGELVDIYGWLSSYMSTKGITMAPFKRPPLLTATLPDNGLARTPPMGWSSWYDTGAAITDTHIRAVASALVSSGLAAAGYKIVEIDDGWTAKSRDSSGSLIADSTKFPSGMAATVSYIHSLGLSAGLYTADSALTCAGYIGSYRNEIKDALTFAAWGVDALRSDACGNAYTDDLDYWAGSAATDQYEAPYALMGAAIRMTGRSMQFHILSGPMGITSGAWASLAGGNTWRIGTDIGNTWAGVDTAFDQQASGVTAAYVSIGHWNDPDNMFAGAGITDTEFQSQISLWSLLAAPLVLGNNILTMSAPEIAIAANAEVIAVDQDALGLQGMRASHTAAGGSFLDVFARRITGTNTCAIGLFNRDAAPHDITVTFAGIATAIPACGSGPYTTTRDLWAHTSLGTLTTSYTATAVPAHGVVMVKVAP